MHAAERTPPPLPRANQPQTAALLGDAENAGSSFRGRGQHCAQALLAVHSVQDAVMVLQKSNSWPTGQTVHNTVDKDAA